MAADKGPEHAGRRPAIPGSDSGFVAKMLRIDDPDETIRRLRRNATVILVVLTVGVGLVTRSPWQVLATAVTGGLMLVSFQAMVALSDALVNRAEGGPSPLQAALLALRYVLLGLVLCAMFLLPGVGPIPVLLGLSILVLAVLLEAVAQLRSGGPRTP